MSDNVLQGPEHWVQRAREAAVEHPSPDAVTIEPGGSGPHDPGMEARVAALEISMDTVKATLGRIEPKLDRLDERVRVLEIVVGKMDGKLDLLVAKMPSWWQQPASVAAIVALLAGTIALAKSLGVLH